MRLFGNERHYEKNLNSGEFKSAVGYGLPVIQSFNLVHTSRARFTDEIFSSNENDVVNLREDF